MYAILLITALALAAIELVSSNHPAYISCNNSDNEGTLVVYNNATLLQCQNGNLVAEQCICGVNGSKFKCIDHSIVVAKMKTYMRGNLADFVKEFYTDDSMQFADCYKIKWAGYLDLFTNKTDCTKDIERISTAADTEIQNDMCTLNKKVYYFDDEGFYTCKNGVFELQKCVIKKNNNSEYYCVDKWKVENALRSSGRFDEFQSAICSNFSQNAETLFDNYEAELEVCNDENIKFPSQPLSPGPFIHNEASTGHERFFETSSTFPEVLATTEPSPVVPLPSYISCNKPTDEGTIVVYKNATWQQCRKGNLDMLYCINQVNGSSYECVNYSTIVTRMQGYMRMPSPRMVAAVSRLFTDKHYKYADCYKVKTGMPGALDKFKFPDKQDCTNALEKQDKISEENDLCSLKNRVYYLDDKSWYQCENGIFELKKCVIKSSDSKFYCLSKQKIENALKKSGKFEEYLERQNGSFCGKFNEYVEIVLQNSEDGLEECNAKDDIINNITNEPEYSTTEISTATETREEKKNNEYEGGHHFAEKFDRDCTEPGRNVNGIWYQCDVPTKCVLENGQCLSYRHIEVMFRDFYNVKLFGINGAWDENRFNEIRDSLNDGRRHFYENLESAKTGDFKLFGNLAKLLDNEPKHEKIVRIRVKHEKTKVTPHSACHIATKLAPFNLKYIDRRSTACSDPLIIH